MSLVRNQPIILPAAYFPPIPWIGCLLAAEEPIVDIHSWYEKQQLSSRTWIKGPDGPVCLTIPVERRSKRAPLHEKKVSYQENWPRTHFRSIKNYYSNSPYFCIWEEELHDFFEHRHPFLKDWIEHSLTMIIEMLGSKEEYTWSQAYLSGSQDFQDYRAKFPSSPNKEFPGFNSMPYQQVFEPFSPGLSMLDLLFSRGREAGLIAKSGLTQ